MSPAEDREANEDVDVGWGMRFCPQAAVFSSSRAESSERGELLVE